PGRTRPKYAARIYSAPTSLSGWPMGESDALLLVKLKHGGAFVPPVGAASCRVVKTGGRTCSMSRPIRRGVGVRLAEAFWLAKLFITCAQRGSAGRVRRIHQTPDRSLVKVTARASGKKPRVVGKGHGGLLHTGTTFSPIVG